MDVSFASFPYDALPILLIQTLCYTCFNPESNIKGVLPKMLVEICVRDLHKYMIKTSDIFRLDSVVLAMKYKVLMSYATLRLFLIA